MRAAADILSGEIYTKAIFAQSVRASGRFSFCLVAPLGPEGQGGCFDSPSLGPLDSLPTRSDQGMTPWTQKGKVALGVWLKKLFTAL